MNSQSFTPRKGVFMLLAVIVVLVIASSVIGHFWKKTDGESTDEISTEDVHALDSEYLEPSTITYTGESGITYTLGYNELVELEEGMAIPLYPKSNATDIKIGFQQALLII